MIWMSQKYFKHIFVLITLVGATYSRDNDTSLVGRRRGKVNGRIVKLYSGPKPDPILCLREGFQADTVDCSVFYRCLKATNGKYAVYRFQCGPGTIYDPETEICNHPRSTKRSECGGLNSNKLTPSTQKNTENEVDGFNKEVKELPSPINMKLPKVNASVTNSTPSKSETSGNSSTNIYPSATTSNYIKGQTNVASTASKWDTSPTAKPWNYTPVPATYYVTRQPDVPSVQCTSDGFMGDNEDCRKFYRCVNNQRGGFLRYEFSCSESTIWDDDTQGCNHPWAVRRRRCGKGQSYDNNSVNNVDQVKYNEVAANDISQDQTQIPYGSKITQAQTESINLNQNQNYFGDHITQEKINIPQNQAYLSYGGDSESHSQFNYESIVSQTKPQVDRFTNSSQMHNHQSDNPFSSTTVVTSTQTAKETNKCTRVGFIGNSVDCKNFLRCISNERGGFTVLEFSCSDGTLWDEELETCNFAWAVKKCGESKSNRSTKSPVSTIENTFKDIYTTMSSSFYSNEIDENAYTSKSNNQEDKPKSTLKTTLPTLTTEASKFSELYKTDCKMSGFFGNMHDCAKFYRCIEDGSGRFTKYEYKCGDGTLWDSEIQSCNHARSVKSCNTNNSISTSTEVLSNADNAILTTVSLIQTTTQKNMNNDYDSGYGTLHREPPLQSSTTTENIVIHSNECKTSGFLGDNNDCNKFYRCVENGHGGYTRHEFKCGEGTVWDPNIEACNHAWAVKKCGGGPIIDNNNNEISSPSPVPEDTSGENGNNIINQENDKGTESITTSTTLSSTNSVTSATNSPNDCQSNGFMGNNNDCKIFYRCVPNGNGGFIRYEFSCGDGTVWDPNISACNHAWAVEKCGGSTSISTSSPNIPSGTTSSEISTEHTTLSSSSTILSSTVQDTNNECMSNGFLGDKQDCKKFYRCVEDGKGSYTRYEFTCGEGTLWDPKIEACNHDWAVTSCSSNLTPDYGNESTSRPTMKDEETANNTSSQNNQDVISSTENIPSSTTAKWSTPIHDVRVCNTDGFVGDSQDCKKFYRCVNDGNGNFISYEFICGDGTIWDSEISACNHVESVKKPCSTVSTETNKEDEPNYTASSSSEHNDLTSTSKGPSEIEECKQDGFFGDKTDCKKFYRCTDNGRGGFHKYDFTCGEGTIWDQEILACNHASSTSRCGSNDTESQTESYHPQSTSPSSISQSTENTETSSNTDECSSEGFYANTNDCTKFFRCVGDGKGGYSKYDFRCGEGTVWVQDIQACDHDSDPSLCSNEKYSTTTIVPSSQEKPLATTTTTSSTTKYTSSSMASTNPTMQDEMISGSSSTTITSSSTTSESSSAGDQNICEEPGYFGNSKDCKMFYRCVDNGKGGFTKYDFACGDGTIWDQDIIACNHPQDVANPSCENEESPSSTSSTTKTTTTATTMSTTTQSNEVSEPTKVTTTQSSTENSNQEVSSNKPSNNNYTCTEAGFYADPYDCKKFYRCVDWGNDGKTFSIYHFDCGDGTIWDPQLQTCNHEDSVYPPRDCSGNQSQQENNNNTTTTKQDETTESSTTETSTTTTQSTTTTTSSSSSTTESSSTTDQSSTQQSSTTEQTSTQQSTTQQSTTQQSTTQQSTTEKTTTQQSTTASESTTTQQTSTTQQSTTSEQTPTTTTDKTTTSNGETSTTTAQTTTTESITSTTDQTTKSEQQSTTQESNTEQSSENQSTTEQSTTQETTNGSSTTESGQETTTEQQSSDKECPQTDDDQYMFVCPTGFRRHPKYCNLFYQCTEDDDSHEMKVAVFNCPNNTIYDESKTQCVEEEKADKRCEGQIAQKRRVKRLDANYKEPITVGKQKYSCPTVGHFPFENNEECSPVLFKCEVSKSGKLRGLLYQCPEGYVYWSISRRCEPVSSMSGCKRSYSNWHGRYEIPIENTNVARKLIK